MQLYLNAIREASTPISLALVVVAANAILSTKDRSLLIEDGGHIDLSVA